MVDPAVEEAPDTRASRPWLGLLLAVAIAIALVVVGLTQWARSSDAIPDGPKGTAGFGDLTRIHVPFGSTVDYSVSPPVGGDHWDIWQNCGVYSAPLHDEMVVHSMEHGAVWVTYRPDLPAGTVEQLRSIVRDAYVGSERYIVLSPYEGLTNDVVASAWGRQLRLDRVDDPRLPEFLRLFAGGAQSPEKLFPCSGGAGSPER